MAVFLIYGSHFGSLGYTQDPIHQTKAPFSDEGLGGATGSAYNASQGFHNVSMFVLSPPPTSPLPVHHISNSPQVSNQFRLPHRHPTRQRILHSHLLRPHHAIRLHRRRRFLDSVGYDSGRYGAYRDAAACCGWIWVFGVGFGVVSCDYYSLSCGGDSMPVAGV